MKKEESFLREESMQDVADLLNVIAEKRGATVVFYWDDDEDTVVMFRGKARNVVRGLEELTIAAAGETFGKGGRK